MKHRYLVFALSLLALAACRSNHIKENPEWGTIFAKYGITNGGFELRDHTHEEVHFYNQSRDTTRFMPASTFKIFNSLVALETGTAQDENLMIKWDGVHRRPEWDTDMNMRQAFKVSNVPYYQEIARRNTQPVLQHYLDTTLYGNMKIGNRVDSFWLDNSLQISADEQVGFIKKLYFNELPFSERTQRIVRSMMVQEDGNDRRLSYKTGWGTTPAGAQLLWVVGYSERTEHVKENKESMNKSDTRTYPYFFALNFETKDTSKDWATVRIALLKDLLTAAGAN